MAESMQEALEQAGVTGTETGNEGGERGWNVPGMFSGEVNVGQTERWASALGGGALAVYGLTQLIRSGSWGGAVLALVGGSLIYRGTSGHCAMYEAAGINTTGTATGEKSPVVSVPAERGIKVEESIVINNRTPEELYGFWRNFENLPRFMDHLESVTASGNRSHWVAKAPAGTSVEWDAEVYNEKQGELIAWRSLEGSQVDNAGSVHFTAAPGGGGTEVRVVLKYDPPGGAIGAAVAKLFGEEPSQQIREDLRRFKQLMETSASDGQASGKGA
ncbi:MAG TPA: SRPBCC family protein [Pyrinomonadaceae bacterium]